MARRAARGFTLIELMITVAIVGILAAIAYPSYQNSIRKGRRAAAQEFLLDVAQREQQYFLDNRSYGSLTDLGMTASDEVSEYYTVVSTPVAGPPPSFTATATPKGSQVSDGALTINSKGQKTPADKW